MNKYRVRSVSDNMGTLFHLNQNYQIQLSCGVCRRNPKGIHLFLLELSLDHTTR